MAYQGSRDSGSQYSGGSRGSGGSSYGAPPSFGGPGAPPAGPRGKPGYLKTGNGEEVYVDYKAVDDLRRLMTPNGKIYSRKRLAVSAQEQRRISQAIKRARFMALLPYTDATL